MVKTKSSKATGKTLLQGAAKKSVTKTLVHDAQNTFTSEYEKLNTAQKLAVDTIEGPVMVVAGPGTGKTQVLALRAANILQKTQMRPSNILCLTFSRSGATAMRERLRQLIGSDAYRITIETIHSFCNDIISDHPHVFADFSALEQISDVEQYRRLNKIIDQHMPGLSLVSAKAPYLRTADILSRISQLKRESVTDRATLNAAIAAYDEQMETKNKKGTKAYVKNVASARKFKEFVSLFHAYQEMLQETLRYDYDDMILFVLQALKENDWLLSGLQERYQYVLVDEFQDLNGAQNRCIELLTTDPTGDMHPNVFVVGDDDQAIYRFQGANLKNILSFHERFPSAPIIALETSYRCTQPILDAASNVIAHNDERLVESIPGLNKNLNSIAKDGTPPKLLLAQSDVMENWMIADVIEERIHAGVQPSDIAVLVQTNRELEPLYTVLQARSIPVELKGKIDLLSHTKVLQVVAILKAILHSEDSGLLADAIAAECFALHPADIGKLYLARREHQCSLLDLLLRIEELELPLSNRKGVISVRDTLLCLHQKLSTRTVTETLEHVLKDCNLLPKIPTTTSQHQDANSQTQVDVIDIATLQAFYERVKSRAYENPGYTFAVFMHDLELYSEPDYSQLNLQYELPQLHQDGVQLMTAHQSKGLEFHTVLLANFRDRHWDKRRRPASVSIPEDVLFGWEKDRKQFEQHQDERRVAYVATTRAKRELLFTCPSQVTSGDKRKDVSPSAFFCEAGDLKEEPLNVQHPEAASPLLHQPVRAFDDEFTLLLRSRLEHFRLSATALSHFLEDPQIFVQHDLLQMPQSKSTHFAYGNAVHHILAKWAMSVQEGNPLESDQLLEEFCTHLRERELLVQSEYDNLVDMGRSCLPKYFAMRLTSPYPVIHKVEYNVNAHIGDIPIKGKLDRIDLQEPNSSRAIVIDYKTGKPQSENAIREGDYFRQLAFYALLVEESSLAIVVEQLALDFVGDQSNDPIVRSFCVTGSELNDLRALIEQVWEKILALDFTPL